MWTLSRNIGQPKIPPGLAKRELLGSSPKVQRILRLAARNRLEVDHGEPGRVSVTGTRLTCGLFVPDFVVAFTTPHAAWSGGDTRTLCDSCGLIYNWSPDGKRILYRSGKSTGFSDIAVDSARRRVVVQDSTRSLGAAVFSPEERWMAIHYDITENIRPIYIAPVRDGIAAAREQWIAVMDRRGIHVRPWWSPNGQILYCVSDAGGKVNIWAQRLAPGNKHPVGEPFVIYAPPQERFTLSASSAFGPAVGPASILFQMIEVETNIWLGE